MIIHSSHSRKKIELNDKTMSTQPDERETQRAEREAEREKRELESIEKINDFINQHDALTAYTVFQSLINTIEVYDINDKDVLLQAFRDECAAIPGIKFVYYMQLLRIAITGQLVGANILDVMQFKLLGGKQEIIKRLKSFRDSFDLERIKNEGR